MAGRRFQAIWIVATVAMLVAPAAQASPCPCDGAPTACRQACCTAETPASACRCQLEARHEQPLVPAKAASPSVDHLDRGFAHAAFVIDMPRDRGVSREYLAASLAVPIRPPRILFGVWRN